MNTSLVQNVPLPAGSLVAGALERRDYADAYRLDKPTRQCYHPATLRSDLKNESSRLSNVMQAFGSAALDRRLRLVFTPRERENQGKW